MSAARGFGLVELMVALALGLLVTTAALSVYGRTAADARTNLALQKLHESARYAADLLERELRGAGFVGLAPDATTVAGRSPVGRAAPAHLVVAGCAPSLALDLERPVTAANARYAVDSDTPLGCAAGPDGRPLPGADTLTIRRARFEPGAAEPGRLQLASTRSRGALFADGRVPMLGPGTLVHDLEAATYYVSEASTGARHRPSLRRKRLVGGPGGPRFQDEELVDGIEDLQVELGIDGDDPDEVPDRYVTPAEWPAQGTPRTVRFWLLVRAEDRDPTWRDARRWAYSDRVVPPTGDAMRRVLVTRTVFLRNLRRH